MTTLSDFEYADLTDAEADVLERHDDGAQVREIAEETNRAASTVRTLLFRARSKRGGAPYA